MSLAQQPLLRALVAFRQSREIATRWGTALRPLHAPLLVWLDFVDVVDELGRSGYAGTSRGSNRISHSGFRWGELSARAIQLTLRQALEPWHVLGERRCRWNCRYVDASLERLQVHVTGLTPDRK
jgi:uncharacterized protein (DUF2126 family)